MNISRITQAAKIITCIFMCISTIACAAQSDIKVLRDAAGVLKRTNPGLAAHLINCAEYETEKAGGLYKKEDPAVAEHRLRGEINMLQTTSDMLKTSWPDIADRLDKFADEKRKELN